MSTQATRPRPTRQRQPRRRRRRKKFPLVPVLAVSLAAIVVICTVISHVTGGQLGKLARDHTPRWVDKQIIEINGAGRRGEKLEAVNDIVIHYVGNPGTTAQQNHDFYDQPTTTVSSHFLIGQSQCSAYHSRQLCVVSACVCHSRDRIRHRMLPAPDRVQFPNNSDIRSILLHPVRTYTGTSQTGMYLQI